MNEKQVALLNEIAKLATARPVVRPALTDADRHVRESGRTIPAGAASVDDIVAAFDKIIIERCAELVAAGPEDSSGTPIG